MNFFESILDIPGISSSELSLAEHMKERLMPFCSSVDIDVMGNVIALKKASAPEKPKTPEKIMIEAHLDQIGMMVSEITPKGYLHFCIIGGIDNKILPACEVIVHGTEDCLGVIGAVAPHTTRGKKTKEQPLELIIDVGLKEPEKVIKPGDYVSFKPSHTELAHGHVATQALDDRAGLMVLLKVMESLKNTSLPFDLYAVATVSEEIGLKGAKTAAYSIKPNISLTIDVCHGETPDASYNTFPLGSGAIISLGPNIHPEVSKRLIKAAKDNAIPYKIDVDGGSTGTNAWAIQVVNDRIMCGLVSIPVRYMHTPNEVCKLDDIAVVARLIKEFLTQ